MRAPTPGSSGISHHATIAVNAVRTGAPTWLRDYPLGRHVGPARSLDLSRTCGLWRGPFYYADHHGDFIVVIDADPGMGVVRGAEGAQERDVPLKFGQGRAIIKGLLNLACVLVLGSHGHHLRGMKRVHERSPADLRARRRAILVAAPFAWQRHLGTAGRPFCTGCISICLLVG